MESIDRPLLFPIKSFKYIQRKFHSFKKFDKVLRYLCNRGKLGTIVELWLTSFGHTDCCSKHKDLLWHLHKWNSQWELNSYQMLNLWKSQRVVFFHLMVDSYRVMFFFRLLDQTKNKFKLYHHKHNTLLYNCHRNNNLFIYSNMLSYLQYIHQCILSICSFWVLRNSCFQCSLFYLIIFHNKSTLDQNKLKLIGFIKSCYCKVVIVGQEKYWLGWQTKLRIRCSPKGESFISFLFRSIILYIC